MTFKTIIVEKSGRTATVTLNRPDKLNAMNSQMIEEFNTLFQELKEDDQTRCVIFTGAGRAFTAGIDLNSMAAEAGDSVSVETSGRVQQLWGHDFVRSLENIEQITIAAINGLAVGGGVVISMSCDFRIASEKARLGVVETNVGIFFTWGCTPRITALLGPAKAKELIMTGDIIDAEKALRIGLVNQVVPHDQLMITVKNLSEKIESKAPLAIRMTKKLVNASTAAGFGNTYLLEPELVERLYLSQDPAEGALAFKERRMPQFVGK